MTPAAKHTDSRAWRKAWPLHTARQLTRLPEKSYKRECQEKTALLGLNADFFSAFSPTE